MKFSDYLKRIIILEYIDRKQILSLTSKVFLFVYIIYCKIFIIPLLSFISYHISCSTYIILNSFAFSIYPLRIVVSLKASPIFSPPLLTSHRTQASLTLPHINMKISLLYLFPPLHPFN